MQTHIGYIYLPQDDKPQKIDGVHLFIDGDKFWVEAPIKLFGTEKYNLIKGAFESIGYVTLLECNVQKTSSSIGGHYCELSINYIITEIQFNSENSLTFSSLSIRMPVLKKWLRKSVFKVEYLKEKQISINYPDTIEFGTISGFNLSASYGFNQSIDKYNTIKLYDFVTLKIKSENSNATLWEFLEMYRKFKKFLAFLNVFDETDDSFTLCEENIVYDNQDAAMYMKFLMSSYNFKNAGIDDVSTPKFDLVKDDIEIILNNWYSKTDIFHSVNLILEKYFQSRLSRETYFLNSCFAIEIYHRRFKKNNKLPTIEYNKQKKEIINKLESELEIDFFKSKLAYANEPSFRDRLTSLKKEFQFIIPDDINLDDFIKQVVLTRNYIVHRGSSKNTITGIELYYASVYLEALTKWCIYTEIGFQENQLLSMFEYTKEHISGMFSLNKRIQTGIDKHH